MNAVHFVAGRRFASAPADDEETLVRKVVAVPG